MVVGGSGYYSTTVMGVEPDYLTIKQWGVASGDFFTEKDLASRSKVAVLGLTVAQELFGNEDPVGKKIRIQTTPFTVIGLLGSKGSTSMGDDQDDVVMVPLDTALTRLQKDRYLKAIEMSAVSEDLMDEAQNEVEMILLEAHRASDIASADFDVMNQSEIIKTASQTSKTLTTLLAAIAGVSLLVGGIGIMNIMLVSVTERTREIGIRMSVGARKKDILLQFLSESVILSLMGGIVGILLAVDSSVLTEKSDSYGKLPSVSASAGASWSYAASGSSSGLSGSLGLNVVRVNVPPLRERLEDIPLLAGNLLEKIRARRHRGGAAETRWKPDTRRPRTGDKPKDHPQQDKALWPGLGFARSARPAYASYHGACREVDTIQRQ